MIDTFEYIIYFFQSYNEIKKYLAIRIKFPIVVLYSKIILFLNHSRSVTSSKNEQRIIKAVDSQGRCALNFKDFGLNILSYIREVHSHTGMHNCEGNSLFMCYVILLIMFSQDR